MSDHIPGPNVGTVLVTTVRKVTRKMRSINGNPRKVLHTDHGVFTTAPDAMCAFGISDGWSDKRVAISLDTQGQVIDVQDVSLPNVGRAERPYVRFRTTQMGGNFIAACDHCRQVCASWDESDLDDEGRLMHDCEGDL